MNETEVELKQIVRSCLNGNRDARTRFQSLFGEVIYSYPQPATEFQDSIAGVSPIPRLIVSKNLANHLILRATNLGWVSRSGHIFDSTSLPGLALPSRAFLAASEIKNQKSWPSNPLKALQEIRRSWKKGP